MFLIIGLCNYSAKCHVAKSKGCWFDKILFLIAPSEILAPVDFLFKNLKTNEAIACLFKFLYSFFVSSKCSTIHKAWLS